MGSRLTQGRLKELLHYDPETGVFTRLVITRNSVKLGPVANKIDATRGYARIQIDCRHYQAHHLAVLYMKGYLPVEVDHEDQVRDNNRWGNLREVSHTDNMRNKTLQRNSSSGVCGVSWHKGRKKWRAYIKVDQRIIHLGYFGSKSEAAKARKEADTKYGFHTNHGEAA